MTKALKLNCMSCLLSVLYEPSNEVVTGPSKLTRLRVLVFTFISLNSLTGMYQNSVEPLVEANTCRRHVNVLHGFDRCKMHCCCSKAASMEMSGSETGVQTCIQSANSPAATCHPGQQGYLQSSVACASCRHESITSSAAYCSFLYLCCTRSVAQSTGLLQELGKVALSEMWLLAAAAQWRLHLLTCFGMS